MRDLLFSLTDLSCSYDLQKNNKVLHISELNIPKGKLVFLLGASGCGKSTLLETLGLMNNTIASGSILLSANGTGEKVELTNLWKNGNYSRLTEVRKKYYSFIFQNTNLMENFTAYENVCLAGMIKEDASQNQILPKARILMEKIKLPENEVGLQTLAINLSGGQRQRIAFARALTNKATVLFGDEPTGNLDEANASELFGIIRSHLDKGMSAIIVSHDINLAVKFADQIIVITKEEKKGFGEIHKENIFHRDSWIHKTDQELLGFKENLRSLYHAANDRSVENSTAQKIDKTSRSYKRLFLSKEGKVLFGKKAVNLIILSLILFFTFLAIGFANGSLDYLNKKMNSAFVRWITVAIPFNRSEHGAVDDLLSRLEDKKLRSEYYYSGVTPYVKAPLTVWDDKRKAFYSSKSRSVDKDKDGKLINEYVLSSKNRVAGKANGFKNESDLGLIVTRRFLKEFNYPDNARVILCSYTSFDTVTKTSKDIAVPIPIRTVVDELPGKYDLIYTEYFYRAFMLAGSKAFDINKRTKSIVFFYPTNNRKKAESMVQVTRNYFEQHSEYSGFDPQVSPTQEDTLGYDGGYSIQVEFYPGLTSKAQVDDLSGKLISLYNSTVANNGIVKNFYYEGYIDETLKDPTYDEISVYFDKLDRVRAFSGYVLNNLNEKGSNDIIEVDVTKVTEKENFLFLSNVTYTISSLLLIFSTLAVGLFIFNLLKSHLSKVKMNIGTFKAIGLGDKQARNIYLIIIFSFISLAALLSLGLAGVTGNILNNMLSDNLNVEKDINYFKIIDLNTFLALAIILFSAFIISWVTVRRMLNKTPGDLIYNR